MNEPFHPRLEQREGFVVAHLGGTPYEIGVQHGRLLAERIHAMRRTLHEDLLFHSGRAFGLGFLALCRGITAILERHIPPDLKQELRGIADGSGVPYGDVLFFNCFDDLLHSLVRLVLMLPLSARRRVGLACSCFVSLGERTADGQALLGRNLDYYLVDGVLGRDGIVTRLMQTQLILYVVRPRGGLPFISVGWPGVAGVVTGMNEAGLALACLTSALPGATPNATPLPLLYRWIVQRLSRLDDVERALRRSRRTIGNNLLVTARRDHDAALFEFDPRELRRRAPRDGRLVATNHFQDAALAARQVEWLMPNSLQRLQRLTTLCQLHDGLTVEEAQAALLDTAAPDEGEAEPFGQLQNPGTIYSAVLSPDDGRLWLRATDAPGRPFVPLALADLLGERATMTAG